MSAIFVFLSKLLPPFVYPLGLACFLIVLALVLRRPGWQRASLVLALLLLGLGGNRWVALGLARSLEWRYLPPEAIPDAPVIVLLGGGTEPAESPRRMVEVGGAGDRVLYAAELFRQGKAAHILVTGGQVDWLPESVSAAQDMADLLVWLGVPPEALWFEMQARNTYENAVFSARILNEKGIRRILLVTSALHMPRALRAFEAQGLQVLPVASDYTVTEANWQRLWQADLRAQALSCLPGVENLALTTRSLKEYLGILVYQVRGWQ
ncbi:MAG: YdcF family protein [Chloroflexota bacterium]